MNIEIYLASMNALYCLFAVSFGYERVYLLPYKVADTPFHIQGDDLSAKSYSIVFITCTDIVHVVKRFADK